VSSQENAEIVRRAYEAAGRTPEPDVDTLMRLFAEDHVLTTNWGTGDQTSYRGLEGFRQAVADNAELWEDFRNEIEEVLHSDDELVVASVLASGRGRASGTPVERRTGVVIRVRDGQIVSTEYHVSPEDALEAAGLPRSAPNE
jgi:ketosteroid isomerase-like protein